MKNLLSVIACCISTLAFAQSTEDSLWLVQHYTKREVYITMRDGQKLFTAIYEPTDKTEKHPILINRTPYSIAPYGADKYKAFWNSPYMAYFRRNYVMVLQDVRGRYMSEGSFVDVRPFNPAKTSKQVDEASDTYDAIDWLVKNVPGNNGKVGIYGISYPGFYATMGALSAHPALKAASPQAPVTDWFMGDDFHHNGAFMQMDAFSFYSGFGRPRPKPTTSHSGGYAFPIKDNYDFYLRTGALRNLSALLGDSIAFWNDLTQHPNYDEWWQARNARSHVNLIPSGIATLVVGGLFDAEDCFGAWNLYKAIEQKATNSNKLVMGPWVHGGWARGTGEYLGNVRFGAATATWYQQNVELPFFDYHLRGIGTGDGLSEATIFLTGANQWQSFAKWPPAEAKNRNLYLQPNNSLGWSPDASAGDQYNQYTSDPAHPVPYTEDVHFHRTREYMDDDQRFASRRPDVLTYTTPVLSSDITLAGPIVAHLFTSLSTTDADFVVKLIDVFPDDFAYNDSLNGKGGNTDYPMNGYQMLVRGEIMRGRYRNSFSNPQAFVPGQITEVPFTLPDVAHVFKTGHRIMIQIQSSWFPLADRNPQQFVDIYHCTDADFVPSDIRVYYSGIHASHITLPVLEK